MKFIDSHAHTFFRNFDEDRDDVIQRALDAGVAAVFEVGLDTETNRQVLALAEKYPSVFPIVGAHPHEAKSFDLAVFKDFLAAHDGEYIGIGEMGLDYFKDYSPVDIQRKVFEQVLELCVPTDYPLVFHCRAANDDMIDMIRGAGATLKGVMHCFSGGPAFLEQTLELGLHISVGGPVTYPKNDRLRDVVRRVPLDRLMLETDCPFLTPQFRRGKRNEPSYIPAIAEEIARVRGVTVEEIAEATTRNAARLFGDSVAAWLGPPDAKE